MGPRVEIGNCLFLRLQTSRFTPKPGSKNRCQISEMHFVGAAAAQRKEALPHHAARAKAPLSLTTRGPPLSGSHRGAASCADQSGAGGSAQGGANARHAGDGVVVTDLHVVRGEVIGLVVRVEQQQPHGVEPAAGAGEVRRPGGKSETNKRCQLVKGPRLLWHLQSTCARTGDPAGGHRTLHSESIWTNAGDARGTHFSSQ